MAKKKRPVDEENVAPGLYCRSDGTWRIRVTQTHPTTGKRVRREETLPRMSKAEALTEREELRRALAAELADAPGPSPVAPTTTMLSYAKRWLQRKSKRLRPSTLDRYKTALSQRVLPALGHLGVETIRRADMLAWRDRLEAELNPDTGTQYATETLGGWWRVGKGMIDDARAEFELRAITARISPPQGLAELQREQRSLSFDELSRLLDAARLAFNADWVEQIETLAFSGMRPGERAALTWGVLDTERGLVELRRAVWRGHVGPVKNKKPRAAVAAVAQVLERRRRRIALETGRIPGPDELIFPSRRGTPAYSGPLRDKIVEAGVLAGLDVHVTPQVLRRTFNTLMQGLGLSESLLQLLMGHSDKAMTARYTGTNLDAQQQAVGELARRVNGGEG